MSPEDSPQQPKKKSGALKWVAVGCLIVLVLGAGCTLLVVQGCRKGIKFYQESQAETRRMIEEAVKGNNEVLDALGPPVQYGMANQFNINNNVVTVSLPVTGSKASGTATINATKTDAGWTVNSLYVVIEGGKTVVIKGSAP
ncbi:MAG: cytochrome c oxidase assembly factor Coa1 family protein [Planctomycetota bacterium]|jgi:hypothetical protein